jgi:hypothetical protein
MLDEFADVLQALFNAAHVTVMWPLTRVTSWSWRGRPSESLLLALSLRLISFDQSGIER